MLLFSLFYKRGGKIKLNKLKIFSFCQSDICFCNTQFCPQEGETSPFLCRPELAKLFNSPFLTCFIDEKNCK